MYNPLTMPDPETALTLSIIALAVSGLSFAVSASAFYKSHLQKAKVRVHTGTTIGVISNKLGRVVGIQVPCTFVNGGALSGTIQHLELRVGSERWRWAPLRKYSSHERLAEEGGDPYPFTVEGKDSVSRTVEFARVLGEHRRWAEGEFTLQIRGWINQDRLGDPANLDSEPFHVKIGPDLEARLGEEGNQKLVPLNVDEWIHE